MTITDSKEAIASINDRTYDPATRALKVKVEREVVPPITEVRLSKTLSKETIVGKQADYGWAWTGEWSEFMHTKVVANAHRCIGRQGNVEKQPTLWRRVHCTY